MTEDFEIEKCNKVLQLGKLILYPTDTVWGIGCDATNNIAVSQVFKIKKRDESKSLVILVDSMEMLRQYVVDIPLQTIALLKHSITPTTIIYNNPIGLASNVIAQDNTVAIRIVHDDFCQDLIKQFGKPIISTSANISDKPTPLFFKEIDTSILEAVDYVVNLRRNEITNSPSKIIKLTSNGELVVIRE
jgi:L-threonylcarbamoyladenylate synthase